jgi:putative PIN family toxin of toxin-antitoxin system
VAVPRIVLDTNVLVAGLRSQRGASYQVLQLVGTGRFVHVLSVPLVLEYEDVLLRPESGVQLGRAGVGAVLDYVCSTGERQPIHFLWRPLLADPRDDMVLEVAVNGRCDHIITFNRRDFGGAGRFGIQVVPPQGLLALVGGVPWAH